MSQLCFATFARALQDVLIQPAATYNTPTRQGTKQPSTARPKMTSTDAYVVEVLLRWVQDYAPIEDREGESIWRSPKTVSNLMGQKAELHTGFGTVLKDPDLPKAARAAFAKITEDIAPMREADFKAALVNLIKNDPAVSEEAAEKLLHTATKDKLQFYADTFLSAISRPNKRRDDGESITNGLVLAARHKDVCPLCRKEKLVKTVSGERRPLFELVDFTVADDSTETDREVLCSKCAKLASTDGALMSDPGVLSKLREMRARRLSAQSLQDVALDSQLHAAISTVIASLSEAITSGTAEPLSLDPVRVSDKIRPEFFELASRIKTHVLEWYHFIEQEFRNLEGVRGRSRFDVIASQVADFYGEAIQYTDDQQLIFDQVAEWIHTNSGAENLGASIIVTCFFVQNCEVFDEDA